MPHALVVIEDLELQKNLARGLQEEAFTVSIASTVHEAEGQMANRSTDLLLADICFTDGNAVDLMERARKSGVRAVVLVAGENGQTVEEPLSDGIAGFLTRPLESERLRHLLSELAGQLSSSEEVRRERERAKEGRFGRLVGTSPAMQRLYELLARVAPSHATAFITGESGSGKEVVARTIHDLSRRRRKPFLPVNCGAVSPGIMESTLFGHEKGSFTGASRSHRGYFEQADGGTLFLDEITEMPPELQVKLLRVLESGRITRTGSEKARNVDVRILAATNRVPDEAVEERRLREDLYYRLKVLHVRVPPLRERMEDVPLLARTFVEEIGEKEGVRKSLEDETLEALCDYGWPGNVRELRNSLYTAYLLSPGRRLTPESLPPEIRGGMKVNPRGMTVHIPVGTSIREAERRLILTTLAQVEGHKSAASEMLGISVKTLYNRLHAYGYMKKEEDDRAAAEE